MIMMVVKYYLFKYLFVLPLEPHLLAISLASKALMQKRKIINFLAIFTDTK